MLDQATSLHVCVTCQAGRSVPEGEPTPGRQLFDALATALEGVSSPPFALREARCLAACDRGCAAAIGAPGRWSTLLGQLSPAMAADLLAYGAAYNASATGAVMPSRRPASLGRSVLGRLPSLVPVPEPAR